MRVLLPIISSFFEIYIENYILINPNNKNKLIVSFSFCQLNFYFFHFFNSKSHWNIFWTILVSKKLRASFSRRIWFWSYVKFEEINFILLQYFCNKNLLLNLFFKYYLSINIILWRYKQGINMHLTNNGQKKSRNHTLLSVDNCLWINSWYLSMSSLSKVRKLCIIVQILNK